MDPVLLTLTNGLMQRWDRTTSMSTNITFCVMRIVSWRIFTSTLLWNLRQLVNQISTLAPRLGKWLCQMYFGDVAWYHSSTSNRPKKIVRHIWMINMESRILLWRTRPTRLLAIMNLRLTCLSLSTLKWHRINNLSLELCDGWLNYNVLKLPLMCLCYCITALTSVRNIL